MCPDIDRIALIFQGELSVEDKVQLPFNNLILPSVRTSFYKSQLAPVINPSSYLVGVVQSKELRKALAQKEVLISIYSPEKAPIVPPEINLIELKQLMDTNDQYLLNNILVVDAQQRLQGYLPPHLVKILSSPHFAFLFFHAVDNIQEGLIIIDKDSQVLYINPQYSEILGIPAYKVLGKRLSEIEPQALILKTLATGEPFLNQPVKIHTLNKDVVVNISPVRIGNEIIGAISVFQDVTEVAHLHNKLNQYQKLAKELYSDVAQNNFRVLSPAFRNIIGSHPDFVRCLHLANRVASIDAPVLITGESGTGKELLARAIHLASPRCAQPFVEVNCASVPEPLIESELFGYEEGAFTGAKKGGKPGKFQLAHGGTLFLDEIGDMSLTMQAKLLRALQLGIIDPVGSLSPQRVDVRIIAATNKDIPELIGKGAFRLDLFYRINVFHIHLPPLRDRGKDVVLLAQYFLELFSKKYDLKLAFAPETLKVIESYHWPGNVRELENAIHYAVVMAAEIGTVLPCHLPNQVIQAIKRNEKTIETHLFAGTPISFYREESCLTLGRENMERQEIIKALQASRTCTEAIKRLGISRRTFYRKIKKYKISPRAELQKQT